MDGWIGQCSAGDVCLLWPDHNNADETSRPVVLVLVWVHALHGEEES